MYIILLNHLDVLLRSLWLEQIQNIIQYISQEGDNIIVEFKDNFNIPNELALLISDLMYEPTYQVKKYATASLLCIVEKQLLNNGRNLLLEYNRHCHFKLIICLLYRSLNRTNRKNYNSKFAKFGKREQ